MIPLRLFLLLSRPFLTRRAPLPHKLLVRTIQQGGVPLDENGTIRVRVYTGRAQIPLEDATVAITQKSPDGRHHLIAVRVTG